MPAEDAVFSEVGVETPYFTRLTDFPLQLQMMGKQFTLRGCTSFNPPLAKSQGMGHYVAYCRRSDGTWELYDDLCTKPICVKGTTEVFSHLVIYTL
jgi:ubiquitin C-terminal hydrolase